MDATGAVVLGANVTATNTGTSTTKSTVTNRKGEFTLPFLTVGTYDITVSLDGFKTHTETGLEVLLNQGTGPRSGWRWPGT